MLFRSTFASRDGVFSSVIDSNDSILAIDFESGLFSLIGDTQSGSELVELTDGFEEILEQLKEEEAEETLAFISEILESQNEEDEDEEENKKRAPKLVCK